MRSIFKLFVLLIALSSCSKSKPVESYDLIPLISSSVEKLQTQDTSRIAFSQIKAFEWDELVIIPPYSNMRDVREFKVKNTDAVQEQVEEMNYDNFKVLLLYLNSDTIVRYSFVENAEVPVMFHYINYETPNRRLSKEELSNRLYLEKDSSSTHYLRL